MKTRMTKKYIQINHDNIDGINPFIIKEHQEYKYVSFDISIFFVQYL